MPALAEMNFADDLAAAEHVSDPRWKLDHRGGLELWLTTSPGDHPDDLYVARFFWDDYPGKLPPSVKFVDPSTGRLDVKTAWPIANGFRPGELDICANWTAEGFRTHPEWADTESRWRPTGNVMLRVSRLLQQELDISYGGRFRE